jgi:hypothetical protein
MFERRILKTTALPVVVNMLMVLPVVAEPIVTPVMVMVYVVGSRLRGGEASAIDRMKRSAIASTSVTKEAPGL